MIDSCLTLYLVIDIRKCNFQNISAFMSNTSKKYYLIHFDCYLKSNSAHSPYQILPLTGIVEGRVNAQINALTAIDMNHFLRSDRKAYFVSIEGYHTISSYLFFKVDKICHGLEHATYVRLIIWSGSYIDSRETTCYISTSQTPPHPYSSQTLMRFPLVSSE